MRGRPRLVASLAALLAAGCAERSPSTPTTAGGPPLTSGTVGTEVPTASDSSRSTRGPSTGATGPTGSTGDATSNATPNTTGDASSADLASTTADEGSDETTTDATTGDPAPPCRSGCAIEFTCGTRWASELECVEWCEANLIEAERFAVACRDAWAGVSACVGTLTCEQFAEWDDPVRFPYPCSDADVTLSVECRGQ